MLLGEDEDPSSQELPLPAVLSKEFLSLLAVALLSPYLFICGIYCYHFLGRRSLKKLRKEDDRPLLAHVHDWHSALFKIEGISAVVIYMFLGLSLSLLFPHSLGVLVPTSVKTLTLTFHPLLLLLHFFVFDFFMWMIHYVQHHWRWLYYKTHAVHHTIASPTMIVALTGYLPDTCLLILLPLHATIAVIPGANFLTVFLFSIGSLFHLHCIHSEFQHKWDPIFRTLGIANSYDHHVHHIKPCKNLAHFFVIIDKMFGTYCDPMTVKRLVTK